MEYHRCMGCMEMTNEELCPFCGTPAYWQNEPHQLPVGTILMDRYMVGRVLGQGGFGITYIGWDTQYQAVVAIKEFYPNAVVNRDNTQSLSVRVNTRSMEADFDSSRERFQREAQALVSLQDVPEIVGIYNNFRQNGTAYIVMEYVRGSELKDYVAMRGGRLSVEETLRVLEPVVRALGYVHRFGLVHRDISPDNIMLHPMGGAKLLDFGAVRTVGNPEAGADMAQSTEAVVKQGFAPPEQYRDRGGLGPWTDEYALCATVYYCVTGEVPPEAVTRFLYGENPDWSKVEGLTDSQRYALEKGMSIRPEDRFGSMEELYSALYLGGQTPGTASRRSRQGSAKKKKSGKAAIIALCIASVVVLSLLGVLIFILVNDNSVSVRDRDEEDFQEELQEEQWEEQEGPHPTIHGDLPVIDGPMPAMAEPASDAWVDNVLMYDPFSRLDIAKNKMEACIFLDTVEDAPSSAWDVSADGSGRVLMWREGNLVYIGAEGGINGRESARELFRFTYRNGSVLAGDECNYSDLPDLKRVEFGGNYHTDQVTDMNKMFCCCYQLESVDVEDFDVSAVETMEFMFNRCETLTQLDVSRWDTSSVQDMSHLFNWCKALTQLDVSRWDTSSATDMEAMLRGCQALRSVDVSGWDTSHVTSMYTMFLESPRLEPKGVENWDVRSVTNYMEFMEADRTLPNGRPWRSLFEGEKAPAAPMADSSWEENVLMADPFSKLDIVKRSIEHCIFLDTLEDMPGTSYDVSADNSGRVRMWREGTTVYIAAEGGINGRESAARLFRFVYKNNTLLGGDECNRDNLPALKTVTFGGNYHTEQATDMNRMFGCCYQLESVDVQTLDVSNVVDMEYLFNRCEALLYADVSGWDTSSVTNMAYLFNSCHELKTVDVSRWDTSSVTNMDSMFKDCTVMKDIQVGSWDTSRVENMQEMFLSSSLIQPYGIENWDVSNVRNYNAFMKAGRSLPNGKAWETLFS